MVVQLLIRSKAQNTYKEVYDRIVQYLKGCLLMIKFVFYKNIFVTFFILLLFVVPVNANVTPNTISAVPGLYSLKNGATKTYKSTEKYIPFFIRVPNGGVGLKNNSPITITILKFVNYVGGISLSYSANFSLFNGTFFTERNFDQAGNIPFILPLPATNVPAYLKEDPIGASLSGDILTITSTPGNPDPLLGANPLLGTTNAFITAKYNTHNDWLQYYNFTSSYKSQLIITPKGSSSNSSSWIFYIVVVSFIAVLGIYIPYRKHKL